MFLLKATNFNHFTLKLIIVLASFGLCSFSLPTLISEKQSLAPIEKVNDEVLFLPRGPGVELLSLGYRNALADILWFNTVSYFGKHYRGDNNYRWLYHMCDLVTTLDPNHETAFVFGAFMLGWEAKLPEEGIQLLNKAISFHPTSWRYYYLRAFSHFLLNNNIEAAIADFTYGAKLPGAPAMMATIAAKKMLKSQENPEAAVEFLTEMIENTADPISKSLLQKRLDEILEKLKR